MNIIQTFKKHQFLFEELVKRDFKSKYKRTTLGVLWSMLEPLMHLAVLALVFTKFFGRETPHYVIYVFSGNLLFTYFRESTNQGMTALENNAHIFSKINVPKYLFLLSKNVSSLINFLLTLIIYFIFVAFDSLTFHWRFFTLLFPIVCLMIFNVGVGLILSALHVFFKDIKYLYSILTQLLMYMSAIFYNVTAFSESVQKLFYFNPVYCYIDYFRSVVIRGVVPSLGYHAACLGYAAAAILIGIAIYRKFNYKFLYYI